MTQLQVCLTKHCTPHAWHTTALLPPESFVETENDKLADFLSHKLQAKQSVSVNTLNSKHCWLAVQHCSGKWRFNGQRLLLLSWWRCFWMSGTAEKRVEHTHARVLFNVTQASCTTNGSTYVCLHLYSSEKEEKEPHMWRVCGCSWGHACMCVRCWLMTKIAESCPAGSPNRCHHKYNGFYGNLENRLLIRTQK